MLHQILERHLEDFLDLSQDPGLPSYVRDELRAALDCHVFERGVACFACSSCGDRTWVPFSCKRRSFCPSCCGRRMCDIAEHLCRDVLPDVPYRQWVSTVPIWLRFVILRRRELVSPLLAILLRVIFGHLRRKAMKGRRAGAARGSGEHRPAAG